MTTRDREMLLAGNPAPVGRKLAVVLSDLLKRGFHVWDVHVSTDERYEVLLDREIDEQVAMELALPDGVEVFQDHDEYDCQRGFGFLCHETGHCVNGPVSDKKGAANKPLPPTGGGHAQGEGGSMGRAARG